jgi:D-alanyl-D-alanine carboxypeptidase
MMRGLPVLVTLMVASLPCQTLTGAALSATAARPLGTQAIAQAAVDQIRTCAGRLAADDRFSGVFLIEQDGQPLLEFSSSAPGSGPFTMDTPFNIASAAKMFTAVAIGQLVDQGKLRFDSQIGDYLDELPPDLTQVRVDQALTHTAGIRGLTQLTPELGARIRTARTARDLVPLVSQAGLAFAPGSKMEYSNGGFVLLGAVVEAASGLSFGDYVARNILAKAGMSNTGYVEPANAAVRLSRMALGASAGNRAPTRFGGGATPAGGWYSSARDLVRFATALRDGRLVTPATMKAMLTIRSSPSNSTPSQAKAERRGYGYGFGIAESAGDTIVGHNGGAPGANSEVAISLKRGWTAVALSNIDPPAATNLTTFARQVLDSGIGTGAECERIGTTPGPFEGTRTR